MQGPKQYTELVGGYDTGMTNDKGNPMFVFGGETYITGPGNCKTENGKFYIETWIARKSIAKWKAEFVRGAGHKQMQPVDDDLRSAVERATELMQQSSDLQQQAIAILRGQAERELDANTAKIMKLITKPR